MNAVLRVRFEWAIPFVNRAAELADVLQHNADNNRLVHQGHRESQNFRIPVAMQTYGAGKTTLQGQVAKLFKDSASVHDDGSELVQALKTRRDGESALQRLRMDLPVLAPGEPEPIVVTLNALSDLPAADTVAEIRDKLKELAGPTFVPDVTLAYDLVQVLRHRRVFIGPLA